VPIDGSTTSIQDRAQKSEGKKEDVQPGLGGLGPDKAYNAGTI
jgi:hypothetical protein